MNKAHSGKVWENRPSDKSPINAPSLNNLENAVDTIDDRVIVLDTEKATKVEVATLVADVTFEESTGVITVTKKNGSRVTIDTQMEKIAVNFDYDPTTQQIILTLIDDTKQYIDLSALITQYEFLDTDTVAFAIGTDGKVSAIVKEGSIEEKHLRPDYLSDIKLESAKAQASQSAAEESAAKAESYAVGEENSAKYYYEKTKETIGGAVTGVKGSAETAYRTGNVNLTPENLGLGKVDNTADAEKSVKYAESAGAVAWRNVSGKPSAYTPTSHTHGWDAITGKPSAYTPAAHTHDYIPTSASCNRNWQYSGQGGTPNWVWGSNTADGSTNYVWSPSNFSVNYANSAGSTTSATYAAYGVNNDFSCGYIRMYHSNEGGNLQITSPNGSTYEMDAFENEYIRIYAGGSDKHLFRVYANGQFDTYYTLSDAGAFRPRGFDNTLKLGTSGNRWKQLYAGTASISTSDRNFKKEIQGLEEKHLNFFLRLIPVSYQFIDGESGRTHIGFIAQDVEDAMEQCGITALDFAGFCKDVKTQSVPIEKKVELLEGEIVTYTDYEERPVLDADGNPEYIYSLRYEEFIALVTYATQKLYKKVDEMEVRMERMEDRLVALEK